MSDRYRNEHADKPGFIPATNTKDLPRVVAAMTTQMGPVATMEALLAKNEALRAQVAGLAEALHRARKYIDGIEVDPDLYGEQVKRDPGAATAVLLVIDKALAEAAG